MVQPLLRRRGPGGSTRARILELLRDAGEALAVRDVAARAGLHPNSVREQLDVLVASGLVGRERGRPSGRGRPSLRYRALRTDETEQPYRELSRALADELSRAAEPTAAAVAAGDRWGRRIAGHLPPAREPDEAARRLAVLLDDAGFAPAYPAVGDGEIHLRRCPFVDLVPARADVVCGVHLGLIRGVLRSLEAPIDVVELQPLVRPDLCVAYLAASDA